jgi:hypothetical protein
VNAGHLAKEDTLRLLLEGAHAVAELSTMPEEFWVAVPDLVRSRIEPVLRKNSRAREPVIEYLRDLEAVARQESTSREAVQVIASGRRLLGDRTEVGIGMKRTFEMAWAELA